MNKVPTSKVNEAPPLEIWETTVFPRIRLMWPIIDPPNESQGGVSNGYTYDTYTQEKGPW